MPRTNGLAAEEQEQDAMKNPLAAHIETFENEETEPDEAAAPAAPVPGLLLLLLSLPPLPWPPDAPPPQLRGHERT